MIKLSAHGMAAAFSVVTGALENAPGKDGLPKFDVTQKR
jgi:hypothetical protein